MTIEELVEKLNEIDALLVRIGAGFDKLNQGYAKRNEKLSDLLEKVNAFNERYENENL